MLAASIQSLWNKLTGRQESPKEAPDWSNVPKTLDEALDRLAREIYANEALMALLDKGESAFVTHFHFEGGADIRNSWGFWDHEHPSDLAKWFNDRGIYHADDMTGVLFRTLYRRLKGEAELVEGQIEDYRQYWREQGQDPDNLFGDGSVD